MPPNLSTDPMRTAMLLLLGSMIAIYFASRAAVEAMSPIGGTPRPGWRAIGSWVFIAMTAMLATAREHPEIALGVIFATSVGCLSLIWGIVTFQNPLPPPAARWRRVWPFVLPAAVIPLMAGFSGQLTLRHAIIMLVEGAVIWFVWRDPSPAKDSVDANADATDAPPAPPPESETTPSRIGCLGVIQLLLGVLLGGLGVWAAVQGTIEIGRTSRILTSGLVAATLLSPILVLPLIGMGSALSQRGQTWVATTTSVAIVLLNLCLLLPVVILMHYSLPTWKPVAKSIVAQGIDLVRLDPPSNTATTRPAAAPATSPSTTRPATMPVITPPTFQSPTASASEARPFPYPMAVWRVDTVLLIVLGMMLLPLGLGRWTMQRGEALTLIVAYVAYLLVATILGARF